MKNWKTTACGAVIAAAQAISTYQGHKGWQGYVIAGALAALGYFSQDFSKAGASQQ